MRNYLYNKGKILENVNNQRNISRYKILHICSTDTSTQSIPGPGNIHIRKLFPKVIHLLYGNKHKCRDQSIRANELPKFQNEYKCPIIDIEFQKQYKINLN